MRAPTWILVPILAAGCAGSSSERAAKPESPARERASPPAQKSAVRGPEHKERLPAKPKVAKPKKAKAKPQRRQRPSRALPWRRDGTSLVAHVRTRRVAIYTSPRAKRPVLVLRKRDPRGTQRAFLVRTKKEKWLRVYLPTRPNGSVGWVRKRAVRTYTNGYRLVVRLRTNKLSLWRGDERLATWPVAAGKRATPTPRGVFYIVELLKPRRPNGAYGPYAFGLSAHSTILKRFAGGDGRVGIHGTNQPSLIGSDVSSGCIRLQNPAIRRLARILPLGTPVHIRS
jgi:lipoprotein-anchoring transpeptidase ErfK/SrfK